MIRAAILGCGPRGKAHARAYSWIQRGALVAACDRNAERLAAFGEQFSIPARYAELPDMLAAERPDVLHVVTLPQIRVEPLTIACEMGVPVVVVEKPIALQAEDWRQLKALAATTATRICVNTQLHFHAANLDLKQTVASGAIGAVRLLDCSARSTPLDQGVHLLELAHSYAGFAPIRQVFGQVAEAAELDARQPAPGMATMRVGFEGGLQANLMCGLCAPFATDLVENKYHHKRIAAYGDDGFIHWTMRDWERRTSAGHERGEHDYGLEDDRAQARLTEAAFDQLAADTTPHPCRIERALDEFEAILALYVSALSHRPVELPFEPPDGLLSALRQAL